MLRTWRGVSTRPMGEAEAFAALFAQHQRLIRAYSARRVGPADAEEVTAEVFLPAWQRWDVSQSGGLPWLYRTASHAVANHLRSRHRCAWARATAIDEIGAVIDQLSESQPSTTAAIDESVVGDGLLTLT